MHMFVREIPFILPGSGGNTYLWQPPTYLEDPTDPNTGVNVPPTDMYYFLIAYNELGCVDTDVVFIDLLPEPDIDAGQDYTIALGALQQLDGDGGVPSVVAGRNPLQSKH